MTQSAENDHTLGLCIALGGMCLFGAIAAPLAEKAEFAERNELTTVEGVIQGIQVLESGRGCKRLDIYVSTGEQRHWLVQWDHSSDFPKLLTLQKGDPVTALVKQDGFPGSDLEWYWDLRRNDEVILGYDEFSRPRRGGKKVSLIIMLVLLPFAALFFGLAIQEWKQMNLKRKR